MIESTILNHIGPWRRHKDIFTNNALIIHKAIYRKAPATPRLFKNIFFYNQIILKQ